MPPLVAIARFTVVLLGIVTLLGLLWYATDPSTSAIVFSLVLAISSFVAAAPQRDSAPTGALRSPAMLACIAGIAAAVILLAQAVSSDAGADGWTLFKRLAHIGGFFVIWKSRKL